MLSWAELDAGPSLSRRAGYLWDWVWRERPAGNGSATHYQSGPVAISLTVRTAPDNSATARRTIRIPPTPGDFGLESWGAIIRTQAEAVAGVVGIHVRNDKLAASGLSLSHWDYHWLEWELMCPRRGASSCCSLRHPARATRELSVDGKAVGTNDLAPPAGMARRPGQLGWRLWPQRAEARPQGAHRGPPHHPANTDGIGLNLDYLTGSRGTRWVPDGLRVIDDNGYSYGLRWGVLVPGRITRNWGAFTYSLGLYPGTACPEARPRR